MAMTICPMCGSQLDSGGYCSTCLTYPPDQDSVDEISENSANVGDGDDADGSADRYSADGPKAGNAAARGYDDRPESASGDSESVLCPFCHSMRVAPGEECPQCGEIVPDSGNNHDVPGRGDRSAREVKSAAWWQVRDDALDTPPALSAVRISFPNGSSVRIPEGRECCIGRESDIFEIKRAIAGNGYVSRKHCTVRVDGERRTLSVRDEGSTNGTFVGNERHQVFDKVEVPLPAVVWLGSHVKLSFEL